MTQARFLTGRLLLAMPGIGDPRFEHAVVAMCAHDDQGALGIGIGHILEGIGFHQLLGQLGLDIGVAPDVPVHFGGPVEPGRGFVLHSTDWGGEGSLLVAHRWALTSTQDILKAIAAGRGPSRWLVALGYAGWGAGQLDDELHHHGWHVADADDLVVFEAPAQERWTRIFHASGIDPRLLSNASGTA
ncbi:MAG: YqgE/AlgH family protein [Chakrabartia sp.]